MKQLGVMPAIASPAVRAWTDVLIGRVVGDLRHEQRAAACVGPDKDHKRIAPSRSLSEANAHTAVRLDASDPLKLGGVED